MDISQATLQPPAIAEAHAGVARHILARTGVAVSFFGPDGEPMPPDTESATRSDLSAAALTPLARQAASQNADQIVAQAGLVSAAWPIRLRRRTVLVAAARVLADGEQAETLARHLLAATAEAVRAGVEGAAAKAENTAAAESLLQSYEEVSLLHHLGEVLRVNRPVAELLERVCQELLDTTGAEATAAYLPGLGSEGPETTVVGQLPFPREDLPHVISHLLSSLGADPVQDAARGFVIINNHCQDDPALAGLSIALKRIVLVPLPLGEGRRGALLAANRDSDEFGSPDAKLIRSTASASGIFIENRGLYRELQEMMLDLVRALVSSVDAKDPYTCGHSERVAITCRRIAAQLGMSAPEVERVYLAGLLHDIGKIGTPEHILRKEGRLEPEERMIMIRHPEIGARILAGVHKLEPIHDAVMYHHERIDGHGYPSGLAGEQIPLLARIVGMADAFDAMTSNRPYRPMLPLEQVKHEIQRCIGTQFDETVAQALLGLNLHHLMREFVERPTIACI
jgi:putative nucleotidyltransferase with HDIG domain